MLALKIKHRIHISDMIRRIILSWLIAVVIEYFILPSELRNLAELDGLARRNLSRGFSAKVTNCSIIALAP